jgi:hypothetical protein
MGTHKNFNLCVPNCPTGFIESSDGLSCQAEYTKRKAILREACYVNETRVGGRFCLSPCPLGYAPSKENEELCYALMPPGVQQFFWSGDSRIKSKGQTGPIISKIVFSRTLVAATCDTNYKAYASQCYADCPINSLTLGSQCVADCPADFKSNANQTACIRPIVKSKRLLNVLQKIGDGILNALYVFIAFIFVIIVVTRLA